MTLNMGVLDTVLLDILTCGYCRKIYKDPRILPCNHTYCGHCLLAMKKNRPPFSCPQCKLPLPLNIENARRDLKTTQLLSKALIPEVPIGKNEIEPEVDPELEKWFREEKCPKAISEALIRNGYWELAIILEMTEVEVSQLGLLPGLEKKLLSMISNSKRRGIQTRSSTALSRPPTYRPLIKTSSDGDEKLPPKWHEVERFYDGRVLVSGSQPNDSLRFLLFLGEKEWEKIVELVKEQGHAAKEDKTLAEEIKAECCRKVALVLCDAGAYDDGVDYARLALNFSTSNEEKYDTKVLLVYSMYRKIAEDNWGQNLDQKPLHKELVELCDDIIKNQVGMFVSKLSKVHIQKALTLNRLYELDKLVFFDESMF